MTQVEAPAWTPMTDEERAQFDRDGILVIPGVLNESEIKIGQEALAGAFEKAQQPGGHGLNGTGSLHQLSAVTSVPELAFLLDHPTAFKYIWSLLGWNVHVYHSHVDVHPKIKEATPDWWHWHQDGGRQNREIETDPRPMFSVKLAYWFSDVSETGRGNFTVIPGSHKTNWLPGPPKRDVPWPTPEGATQITANPGDLVVFDRRIWHARSDNFSDYTRMGAFLGYTYRWIAGRDDVADLPSEPWWNDLNDVQKQLLGHCPIGADEVPGDHAWGHYPKTTPLYGALKERGLLDSSIPALIP